MPLSTLHIDNLRGENAHHQAETVFKAFARALRAALELDPRARAPFRRPRARSKFYEKNWPLALVDTAGAAIN